MTQISLKLRWLDGADTSMALPAYQTSGSAGADLRANFPPEQREAGLTLAPMARAIVPTGLAMEIPEGFEVQVRARSGLAFKHGIMLPNAPGTIDADYRGPVGVILLNAGAEPFHIAHGDRIAQMVVARVEQVAFDVVSDLSETERGSGGYGSTGV